jgi:hypothetical protein
MRYEIVINWEYHCTVGDGRVGSYAESKAAGLSKAGCHVIVRRELQRGVEVMRGHSFDLSKIWLS